jgi:hypothetical protein
MLRIEKEDNSGTERDYRQEKIKVSLTCYPTIR